MFQKYSLSQIGITRKNFLAALILLFNVFTWLEMTIVILNNALTSLSVNNAEASLVWALYYGTVIGSSLSSPIFTSRIRRLRFLYFWMILGMISSLLPALFTVDTMAKSLGLSFLLALSLGLGLPQCISYFADSTSVENRGRLSGIVYLAINIGAFISGLSLRALDLPMASIASATWRGLGLIIFLGLVSPEELSIQRRKTPTYLSILHNKSFVLYFIPWLMFSLINGLEAPILEQAIGPNFYGLVALEFIIGSLSALIAGLLCDLIGRKRVILYGFITLGIGYASLGIAPSSWISWYFYSVIDGVAWGIFSVTFILMIWSDLFADVAREKPYAIGGIPFTLSSMIQRLLYPYVNIAYYAAFSLASFFLFLAVLPLMYAPETLPEKKMEIRRLKGYIEQAKKFTEKYTKKTGSKS